MAIVTKKMSLQTMATVTKNITIGKRCPFKQWLLLLNIELFNLIINVMPSFFSRFYRITNGLLRTTEASFSFHFHSNSFIN